ncbi:MAG: DUF1659 domain-containing protein [Schwartzia sp.]|nr:DUF1659 domain-containing protein [Schwartzia sp. (in: firmicutes)]
MAITKTKQGTKLLLTVESGMAADGSTKYSQRSIKSVNPALTDEDAYEVATAVGALQAFPVVSITRQDLTTLASE